MSAFPRPVASSVAFYLQSFGLGANNILLSGERTSLITKVEDATPEKPRESNRTEQTQRHSGSWSVVSLSPRRLNRWINGRLWLRPDL